jgi:hypothetical protein
MIATYGPYNPDALEAFIKDHPLFTGLHLVSESED